MILYMQFKYLFKKHQYEEKGDRERVEKEGKKRTF